MRVHVHPLPAAAPCVAATPRPAAPAWWPRPPGGGGGRASPTSGGGDRRAVSEGDVERGEPVAAAATTNDSVRGPEAVAEAVAAEDEDRVFFFCPE